MREEIQVKFDSLQSAIRSFARLEESLLPRGYMNSELMNESLGKTFYAVNQFYRELSEIERELQKLAANMHLLLEQAGIRFSEFENDAADDFREIRTGE